MFHMCAIPCGECEQLPGTVFSSISGNRLDKIKKQYLKYKKGEIVFHAGDTADHFYCISAGMVQLFRANQAKEQSFAVVEKGNWIGFRDVLADVSHQHSARCVTEVVICKISGTLLSDLMAAHPALNLAVIKQLAHGWVLAEHHCYNMGARKVAERLADFILNLNSDMSGNSRNSFPEVHFPLTRETVATIIGTTTESVIRTLSDFKSRGWIEFREGKLRLTKKDELERLVIES